MKPPLPAAHADAIFFHTSDYVAFSAGISAPPSLPPLSSLRRSVITRQAHVRACAATGCPSMHGSASADDAGEFETMFCSPRHDGAEALQMPVAAAAAQRLPDTCWRLLPPLFEWRAALPAAARNVSPRQPVRQHASYAAARRHAVSPREPAPPAPPARATAEGYYGASPEARRVALQIFSSLRCCAAATCLYQSCHATSACRCRAVAWHAAQVMRAVAARYVERQRSVRATEAFARQHALRRYGSPVPSDTAFSPAVFVLPRLRLRRRCRFRRSSKAAAPRAAFVAPSKQAAFAIMLSSNLRSSARPPAAAFEATVETKCMQR
jgi:hypothetical protein